MSISTGVIRFEIVKENTAWPFKQEPLITLTVAPVSKDTSPGMTSSLACDPACWLCTLGRPQSFEDEVARKLAALRLRRPCDGRLEKGVLGGGPKENTKLMTPFLEDRDAAEPIENRPASASRQAETDAGKVAATGYCFGGLCVLDLARTGEDFKGATSFHGLFNKPGNTEVKAIKAKILALHGWDDPMVPPADVVALAEELTAAGADWQIHGYGNTLHAFTNSEANAPDMGAMYKADADRRSWQAMENFLAEVLA